MGHLPSTRREGVASLSLDGLVKNAETLQLLPNRSQCPPPPPHPPFPLPPLIPRPQQLQSGGRPKTLSTPIAFHHQARFTLPAALTTKGERTCVCCICKSAGEFSFILAASHSAVVGTGGRFARPPSQYRI